MKILHVCTLGSGGAFNAAKRLHCGLLEQGVDSMFLSLQPTPTGFPGHILFPEKSKYGYSFEKRVLAKLALHRFESANRAEERKQVDAQLECFSSPKTDFKLAKYINDVIKPDVVNLHWVANFLDYESFFSEINRPVVWTLHDENPFGGYWHYEGDRIQKTEAEAISQQYLTIKGRSLKNHKKKLEVVAPSHWLTDKAQNSEVLGTYPCTTIRNGIDIDTFARQTEHPQILNNISLKPDETIGMFICQSLDNERKGMDLLIDALEKTEHKNIRLLAVGDASEKMRRKLPNNTIFTGNIESERELTKLYSFADFTIISSREDNLPNTLIESLCCGTPVLGTPAGGIAEILQNKKLGVVATGFSSNALKNGLETIISEKAPFESDEVSRIAHEIFNLEKQALQYKNIYASLKSNLL